ncbi:breast cancer 2 susceptibility protein [Galdieria sulphuraria]|uniref:Breast cancer 2 susceptibility protein n=1 Tax=Galdieria sulphuraria TaxID=130081 RepID=M2W4G8_GALSU|nr:breast cancer 2 susceptibility protein [Galdieria sulphuraria]EME30646.1 breast cancer 2 susceptibility protein [Galdieria sulphuraria]|eukprot:XP_005707166.1 breast cancer 2 susceptibility protein [Galdieria sulphuraria]
MEEKIPCPSKQVEIITATFQQCYDPYYGIIQVQVPCTTKSELSVVNIDMEQVMGNALQSSVLVSACYLERVETKRGERDWLNGLEEMTLFNQQQFKAETFSAENKTVELLQNHIQDDSEDWQRSERIININEDSKRKEISDNKLFEMESLEERLNALSSFHKYEAKRFTDNVATPLFVTGGGKEVKTKDVSNEWAKSFLAEVVVPECDGNSRSSLSDLAKEEHMLQVNSSLQKQDADYERKQDVIFTTGKGKHISITNDNLQRASMILKEASDEKVVLTNPKMELKRKLTNSVLKRARKALYDNRTPNKTMDNKHCTPGSESRVPLLRSYPDSNLPMKRTPSGITDSMLKRRKTPVGNSRNVTENHIPKSVVERRVKKHIPFHYICSSLAGQPVQPGYHIKKVSLKELLKRKLSENRCGIFSDDPELSTCLQDPVRFRFKDSRMNLDENFSISPEICYLKPDCHSTVGLEEFTEHLRLLFPDADGPLMKVGTNSWIRNAYRLLMWKLASLEVFFHPFLRNKLNALNLGIEFSKRLEREWNLGHRSILHKIVERDALVGSHYILFISDIFNENFIEVSDGWYCVRAKIDSLLCDAILKKKLFKGCKISVCSASFHHFDEENPENTVLSLHFNGVRRARWNCKLGPRRHPPVLHGMSSLRAMGGQIPCVEVVIERSFPVRFVESDLRDETKTRKVFRNEEDEERIVLRRNEDISIRLDEIFKKEEQASSEMTNPFVESERDVSRMTEILVVDRRGKRRAYVTFWRPTDNALEILRNEGYVIRLYGVIPSKRLFDSEILHMAVPSKMPIQVCSTKPLDTLWIPRYSLSVSAIASLFSGEEFDSCFVILLVGDLQYGRTRFIYLMQTIDGPVTAVKLFDEQAQNIPSVIKRATRSSKKIALVAVKNLKFICCDKRCGIYFCHHTSRCVWLSEQEAKVGVESTA